MSWPTVRRYPRSMREAWPQDHASAIEHYARKGADLITVIVWFIACAVIGVLVAQGVA